MNIVNGGAAQSNQTVISAATIMELAIIDTVAKIMFVIQTREEFCSSYYRSIEWRIYADYVTGITMEFVNDI